MVNSWWTQSMLETYRFKLFFSVTKFRNQNISKIILEVYFTFTVQNYIWSIAQFQQDKTNKSLHNLWSNGLVVRVQVYLTKDPRFKTIRWLKNCLSFHPSKVNLWISRIPGDLVVKSKSSQWLCCLQTNELYP